MNSDTLNTALLNRASRYALAVGAVTLGTLLRYGMDVWVGPGLPTYITFYPAVILAALLGGFGPGLMATVLAAVVVDYLLLLPVGFGIAMFRDAVGMGLFFIMGVFMSATADLYRRARVKAATYDREVALREVMQQKAFLADILQRSSQPFAVGYPDGRLGLLNSAFEQLTGYTGDELKSIDWINGLTPPEWQDIEQEKLEDLRRTGQPVRYEKEYIRKDGTRIPIELLIHLMNDAEGKTQYYYSFLTDITERKQAEQALQQQRRELQMIIDSVPAMVFYKDTENRFIRTNRALENAMGLSKNELEGKSIFDLYPEEQADAYWRDDKEVMASGDAKHDIIESMTTHRGTRLVQTYKIPYLNEEGAVAGVIGFALDITERKQAEQALWQSEERLRLAQQVAKIGVFEWNVQTGVNVWSPELEAMYGLAPGEFGRTQSAWEQLVHPEDRAAAVGLVNQTFETGEPVEGEWRVVWRDGSVHWIAGRFQMLKDAAGKPLRLSGVNLEITERKQAEKALRESNQMYRAIGESIDYGVWVCEPDGRNIYASQSFLNLVGLTQEQCSDFGWGDVLHPDDSERTIAAWKECVRTGGTWDIEHRFRGVDGQWHPVLARGVPVRDEQGSITAWAGINLDISRLKKAEEALHESEERFRTLANAMPQLAWIARADGHIFWYNQRWYDYTGTTFEQMEGWGWQSVHDPVALPAVLEQWRAALAAGQTFDMEFPLRGADGHFRQFLTRGVPLKDEAGRIVRWFGTNTDITERKQAEEALKESQEDLNRAQAVAQIGSWRLNVQRNELHWSAENWRIFGLPRGTPLTYETFLGTVHPQDREYVNRKWQAALCGEHYDLEHRIMVDGAVKWVRERAELEFDQQGVLRGGFGTTQDITERKEAEEALRNSEQRLRLAMDIGRIGCFERDLLTNTVIWDEQAQKIMGLPEGTPDPAEVRNIVHPDDHAMLQTAMDQSLDSVTRSPYSVEFRLVRPDGQLQWMTALGRVFFDESATPPRPQRRFGVIQDITERKKMEEALRQSRDELELRVQERTAMLNKVNELLRAEIAERQKATEEIQDLYNNAPCGYHSLAPDGTFVRINNTELSLLGYSRDEVIGRKKFSDLLTASSLDFFKKSFPLFKERGFVHDIEFDIIRKDGSTIPVQVSATAILDEQGKYVMSRSSLFDITERRRAEETLRESEEQFRLLIHTAPVVIVSLAPDGTILEFNPEAELAYGRTRAEVLGRNYLDLFIPAEQHDMVTDAMKRVMAGEPISSYENPIRSADGSELFYIWNIDRVVDDTGKSCRDHCGRA